MEICNEGRLQMPRYLVIIRETIEYSREFTAKDEEIAKEKAEAMFEKDPKKFDQTDAEYEIETEEP